MVCVLSMAAGACWVGLNMKMQIWEIRAAPLLCTVRSFNHAFNLLGRVFMFVHDGYSLQI